MANPWLLLGAGVLWLASLVGAYLKGEAIQKTGDEAATALVLKDAVKQANEDAAINYQAALEVEQEKQANDRKHQSHSHSVATAVAADPKARDCGLSSDSLGVLISSIRASNGAEATPASGVDGGLQPGSGTAGPVTRSGGVGAGQHGLDPIDVQIGPQGTARVGN
jgi:hypothetical protein